MFLHMKLRNWSGSRSGNS